MPNKEFKKPETAEGWAVLRQEITEAFSPGAPVQEKDLFAGRSAQITALYNKDELIGKQVIAVVNFPVKQIANFFSECLVLGVYNEKNEVVLLQPTLPVKNGSKVG